MFNTKTVLAAASLAVLAGMETAAAAPWDHPQTGRAPADRQRIAEALRQHHYQVMDDPYFVHGRCVVRAHDRLGHLVFVQVDPVSGAFVREVIL